MINLEEEEADNSIKIFTTYFDANDDELIKLVFPHFLEINQNEIRYAYHGGTKPGVQTKIH